MSPDFSKNFATNASLKGVGSGGGRDNTQENTASAPSTTKRDVRYFLSVLLFAFSVVGVGGMFGVNVYFDREIVSVEQGIGALEETIKVNDIATLALFDKQVRTLKGLTVSRGGYNLLLNEVSRLVVPSANYTSVSISFSGNDTYMLTVEGSADSLEAYYQQMEGFMAAEGLLEGVSFDNYSLRRDKEGNTTVLFTVSIEVPVSEVAAELAVESPK